MSSDKIKMMEKVQLSSLCVWDQTQSRREAPRGCFESRELKDGKRASLTTFWIHLSYIQVIMDWMF